MTETKMSPCPVTKDAHHYAKQRLADGTEIFVCIKCSHISRHFPFSENKLIAENKRLRNENEKLSETVAKLEDIILECTGYGTA